jgi:hypothetical protein
MGKMMKFVFYTPPKPIPQNSERQNKERMRVTSFGTQVLPLMWAKVTQQTGMQTVDLELTNGMKVRNVPVASSRWVRKGTTNAEDEGTGRKDLPRKGTNVLVAFPDGVIDNATVLPISKFDVLQGAHTKTILKQDEQNIIMDVDDYGWIYSFDKDTGKITYQSPEVDSGNRVSITMDVEGNSIVLQHQYSTTSTDKNVITINDSGISIVDSNGNEITLNNTGLDITDKNGNTIESTATSLIVNGNLEVLQ